MAVDVQTSFLVQIANIGEANLARLIDKQPPGRVRDLIVDYMSARAGDVRVGDLCRALETAAVPASSVRSYLRLNTPGSFRRIGRGRYRLAGFADVAPARAQSPSPAFVVGRAQLFGGDCLEWMAAREPRSIEAIVTDPPYGLVEYSETEQRKLRSGRGGVWRIPPSFDGHTRSPVPRFTVLGAREKTALRDFFFRLGVHCFRVAVPGANIVVASNPLFAGIVAGAMCDAGLELRGTLVRLVMTMRGGDRPKNAHDAFPDVSVMPRSMHEPWIVLRRPLEGRVQDNLRRWKTGGFRRPSADRPFGDVIRSSPTPAQERRVAPHPSLKPQSFLRQLVRASLPLGEGTILDPFAGSGSTLSAANAVGYASIGVEASPEYLRLAAKAIPRLAALTVKIDPGLA